MSEYLKHSTFPCPATFSVSAANARLYAIGQNTGVGNFLWEIGRREVENWPKGSGKSTHAVGQGETNMKYDLEGNPVEKCWKWKWKIGRREVENWPKGEKRLHSRTQLTYARVVTSRASLTVRITVKNGDPPGAGKIWEKRFFTVKMDHHGAKCTQIGAHTCQGSSRSCQNFFTFTFKAAGVTFLKVILHLLQNAPIW